MRYGDSRMRECIAYIVGQPYPLDGETFDFRPSTFDRAGGWPGTFDRVGGGYASAPKTSFSIASRWAWSIPTNSTPSW